jgi:sulfonate transport system substrate-binding protein
MPFAAIPRSTARPLWTALTVLAFVFLAAVTARAEDKLIRIGYQKYGTLILLKAKGSLEAKLKPLGYRVAWAEFPAGPPLLEALNAGAIDFGSVGETPPIFAQAAAGARLTYVAHEPPAPRGEAILVPKDSPIHTVADLKGKKVALNKGSNVHYLLVRALEQAGVAYGEIQPIFLPRPMRGPPSSVARWTPGSSGTRSRPRPRQPRGPGRLQTARGWSPITSSMWPSARSRMRMATC